MASVRIDIISIGTLSRNRLWNETEPQRTPHSTTCLIRAGQRNILIDPGLPAPALAARLFERTGLRPEHIDTVFLTNFRPAHRAGLGLFGRALLLMQEVEQQAVRQHLERLMEQAPDEDIDRRHMHEELTILERIRPAEDKLAPSVDLFPLFGYTPGQTGLLLSTPTTTLLVAGDAVPTQEHFLAGQVLPDAYDIRAAHEAMAEAYEIADVIVPGHDNLFLNPRTIGL
jgi:glyoxylase-like metal-dependent hydrolase (beta-lactamase superfamily II)